MTFSRSTFRIDQGAIHKTTPDLFICDGGRDDTRDTAMIVICPGWTEPRHAPYLIRVKAGAGVSHGMCEACSQQLERHAHEEDRHMNKGDRVEASAPPTTTPAACGTGVNVVADKDLVFEHVIDELWPTGRPSIVVRVEAGRIVAINGKTR